MSQIALSAFMDRLIDCEMWSDHCSLESKITPRRLMLFFDTTSLPFILIVIGPESPLWNKHGSVLDSLTRIPELVNQSTIRFRVFSMFLANLVYPCSKLGDSLNRVVSKIAILVWQRGRGFENSQILRDVIYEYPITNKNLPSQIK